MKKDFRTCSASGSAPLADDLSAPLKNYNRALPWLGTCGTLGADGVRVASEAGFRTIIDLRTAGEGTKQEKEQVEAAGICYINLEITRDGISPEQLKCFTESLESAERPVLLHCACAGRVGGMLALYYIQNGMDVESAFALGRAANLPDWYEKILRDQLGNALPQHKNSPPPGPI